MSQFHATRRPRSVRRSKAVAALGAAITVIAVFATAPSAFAAQPPVALGTAGSFAILAGSGITNTGPTTVTGDIGTFPTTSQTGFGSITQTGADHAGDAVTQGAKNDLVTAYDDAAGRLPVTDVAVELGGTTLPAGVYTAPTLGLTGTLTLDGGGNADAEFVFQAGSTLVTAADSQILLVNGANACHVVWQIGSSATFGTRTQFVGDVLAQTSITAVTGATFQGRLLARDGAVTLDTNTVSKATCAAPTGGGAGTGGTDGSPTDGTPADAIAADGTAADGTDAAGSPAGTTDDGGLRTSGLQTASSTSRQLARTGGHLASRAVLGLGLVIVGGLVVAAGRQGSLMRAQRRGEGA